MSPGGAEEPGSGWRPVISGWLHQTPGPARALLRGTLVALCPHAFLAGAAAPSSLQNDALSCPAQLTAAGVAALA